MKPSERPVDHEKFKELAALAHTGALRDRERLDLERHLLICGTCKEAYDGYALLAAEGMPILAVSHGHAHDEWDERPTRDKLFALVRSSESDNKMSAADEHWRSAKGMFLGKRMVGWGALAACLLIAVGTGAYKIGNRTRAQVPSAFVSPIPKRMPTSDGRPSEELIASQNSQLLDLQNRVTTQQQEMTRLRTALHAAEGRVVSLSSLNGERDQQLKQVSEERDRLSSQLADARTLVPVDAG